MTLGQVIRRYMCTNVRFFYGGPHETNQEGDYENREMVSLVVLTLLRVAG